MDDSHDKLWGVQDLFEIVRTNFSKFYNSSEHLAWNKIIVKFKEWVIFKQYTQKTCKHFTIKKYKLWDSNDSTYDMDMYLGKEVDGMPVSNPYQWQIWQELLRELVTNCTWTTFPPLTCLITWPRKKIYCCGTVRLHRKGMPKDLKTKTQKLKQDDIWVTTKGDLTAVVWKDEHAQSKHRRQFLRRTYTIQTEKAIFETNTGMRKSRQLQQITTVTWSMSTR